MFKRVALKLTELCVIVALTVAVMMVISNGTGVNSQLVAQDCAEQSADADGSGAVSIVDALYILQYLFIPGSPEPVELCAAGSVFTPEQEERLITLADHIAWEDVEDCEDADITRLHLVISECNVQIVNGLGATNGNPAGITELGASTEVNGLGNLIIGYNECRTDATDPIPAALSDNDRSGSHNIVVGSRLNYSSFGGAVFGRTNEISNAYATCTGGFENVAAGVSSSVPGGCTNLADAPFAAVLGGRSNLADASWSVVVGGGDALVEPEDGPGSTPGNTADSVYAVVIGGNNNTALGPDSVVVGGDDNEATGPNSVVVGGLNNSALGERSVVSGGNTNLASGANSVVGGGFERTAGEEDDWAAGSLAEDF